MDPIQHHRQHHNGLLQRVQFFGGHDQHDLHDNLHSIYFPSELSARQIRKFDDFNFNLKSKLCLKKRLEKFATDSIQKHSKSF